MPEINLNMSVDLTGGDIKQLITEWAEKKVPGHKVKSVEFSISAGYDDRFSSSPPSLTKATVRMEPRPVARPLPNYPDSVRLDR